jgi:hypothetical protein
LPRPAFLPSEPQHHGDRNGGQGDAHRAGVGGFLVHQRAHGLEGDKGREQEEGDADQALGPVLDPLDRLLIERAPCLGREAPDEHGTGDRLDE